MLYPEDETRRVLWQGRVSTLTMKRRCLRLRGKRKEHRDRQIEYFDNNRARMQYATFRAQGLFVGSGVVEAGCKSVTGQRLKRSGMSSG